MFSLRNQYTLTWLCLLVLLSANTAVQSQTQGRSGTSTQFGLPTDTLPPKRVNAASAENLAAQTQTMPVLSFETRPETKTTEVQPSDLGVSLKVKARFMFRGREATVLLESGGQTMQVRTGSRFTIGSNNVQMRVLEINSAEVRLEVESSKRTVVIH